MVGIDNCGVVEKVDKVLEEDVQTVVLLAAAFPRTPRLHAHRQPPVHQQDGLAQVLDATHFELVEEAGQEHCAAHLVVLAVQVDPVGGAQGQESVDRVEGGDEFVEGQVGVVLEAQVAQLALLPALQYARFQLLVVGVLADVPDLEVTVPDVLLEGVAVVESGVGDVEEVGCDFSRCHLLAGPFSDLVVVI